MLYRIAELVRLCKRKLILPALEKIEGDLFIYRNPSEKEAGELADEIKTNSRLQEIVNEPCSDKVVCDMLIYSAVRLGLGLDTEITEECDPDGIVISRKKKHLAPSLPAIQAALALLNPEKYGKDANPGIKSVQEWIDSVKKIENEIDRAKNE